MVAGLLIFAGAFGCIALVLLMVFRRDVVGVDLTAASLLRLYARLAALAAAIVFVVGASWLLDGMLASTLGVETVYGRPPIEVACQPGQVCPDPAQLSRQFAQQSEQRRDENLIGGVTLVAFGALFFVGHTLGGRALSTEAERGSALRRAYLVHGTFVFGLATLVLVPIGVYQALATAILHPGPAVFKPGFADSLSGGLVAVPVWLVYLLPLVRAGRAAPEQRGGRAPMGRPSAAGA